VAATLTSARSADGQFFITINGTPGSQYQVEASIDLVHWTAVNTNTAPFTYVDGNASQYAQRFYRAASLPTP
jgi:hypothetical protein